MESTVTRRLRQSLENLTSFAVGAELTGGPGYDFRPVGKFLADYRSAGTDAIPAGFEFVGVAVPQNPGGVANLEPTDILAKIDAAGMLGELDFIPHISCKDSNADGILSSLVGYKARGVETVLALTGDRPVSAKGVFELESVTLLKMIRRLNHESILKAAPGSWDRVHRFFAGAAVSPFKYTEPSLVQQYYKMERKVTAGAGFIITQVGWDWKKSLELMRYVRRRGIDIPLVGEVYLLTTTNPAPRLMHDGKLPGCYVSDELLARLRQESYEQHLDRAAQQIAMYRALGYSGMDVGGTHDFATFQDILRRAAKIGAEWELHKDNLCFPPPNAFYLYNTTGEEAMLSSYPKTLGQRFFSFMHRAIMDPSHRGFHWFRSAMKHTKAPQGKGFVYRTFNATEKSAKSLLFDCESCGDCLLPEHCGVCTIGPCAKGLSNVPCGDATAEGKCGNDLKLVCVGERVYQAAAAEVGGRDKLRKLSNSPRNPALEGTSSVLNYLFGKDHTMPNAIISIGEAIHASIPKTGKVMKELHAMGPEAYSKDSPQLQYIRALIETQADEKADYLAVNLDAFGESDPSQTVRMMREYTRLVRRWGGGTPICFDSSNDEALVAGLEEWYSTGEPVKTPLINSIKIYSMDKMFPLKSRYNYNFIGLLVSEGKPQGPGGSHSVEELYGIAKQIFQKATANYGFRPEQIFFDSTVFPLAIDMPMEPGVPGYTYRAFETIRRIKTDPAMKGVHCSLGVSNCCRDLPGRKVGVCRAYVAKAMEYGLDAGIVNTSHQYGQKPADLELLELVTAFAKLDGTAEPLNDAMMRMGQFCADNRKG